MLLFFCIQISHPRWATFNINILSSTFVSRKFGGIYLVPSVPSDKGLPLQNPLIKYVSYIISFWRKLEHMTCSDMFYSCEVHGTALAVVIHNTLLVFANFHNNGFILPYKEMLINGSIQLWALYPQSLKLSLCVVKHHAMKAWDSGRCTHSFQPRH
jgi:hypothetical protein